MNNIYLNSIYTNRGKRLSNNAAQARYGNRITFESNNIARDNLMKKNDTEPAMDSNQSAFDPNSISSMISNPAGDQSAIYTEEIGGKSYLPDLTLNKQNILNGIIFSEILGKPKSKRRGL